MLFRSLGCSNVFCKSVRWWLTCWALMSNHTRDLFLPDIVPADLQDTVQPAGDLHKAYCRLHHTCPMILDSRVPLQARKMLVNLQEASSHALDAARVRSVLACGFYPLFGRLLPPGTGLSQRSRSTLLTGKGEKVRHYKKVLPVFSKLDRSILEHPSHMQLRDGRHACLPWGCQGMHNKRNAVGIPQSWQGRPWQQIWSW